MWLRIEPLDVWLFREGKPFSAGESFRATSVFPPSARPLLGALRTSLLVRNGVTFHDYQQAIRGEAQVDARVREMIKRIGTPDDLGPLSVRGPFLTQAGKVLFPMPLDLLFNESAQESEYLTPRSAPWQIECGGPTPVSGSVIKLPLLPFLSQPARHYPDRLLNAEQINNYLQRVHVDYGSTTPADNLWTPEPRTGIKLAGTRTTEEGMLYTVGFVRLAPRSTNHAVGLLLEVHGFDSALPARGLIALGGERRAAAYDTNSPTGLRPINDVKNKIKTRLCGQKGFRLYLATPAVFKRNGWFPDFLHARGAGESPRGCLLGRNGRLKLKLVAAAVGKPIHQAGWDLVRRRPRPLEKAVPAGSVYYLRKVGGTFSSDDCDLIVNAFHFQSILRRDWSQTVDGQPVLTEDGKAGLGVTLAGCWPEESADV